MATLGASMVTLLTDNWAGAGAAPTFGFLIDFQKELEDVEEQVLVRLPIHEDVTPINDNLSNFKFTMQLRIKTTVSEARLKVLTDETIRIINTYAITGITRQFAKRGENTSDRKRQVFSYDVWASLEEHASTAGTSYSSPGAGDVVFPADVDITGDLTVLGGTVLIDNDSVSPTLTVHTDGGGKKAGLVLDAIDDVYFDFKASGVRKAEIFWDVGNNRFVVMNSANAVMYNVGGGLATFGGDLTITGASPSITGTNIADLLMFGSANAAWIPVAFDGWSTQHPDVGNPGHRTLDAANPTWQFVLGRPTAKGSLKLYINGVRIVVTDADGAAYVDQTRVMGSTDAAFTSVYTDGTNADSAAVWESGSGFGAWGAATDMSSYGAVRVYLNIVSAGLGRLDISSIQLSCYYA